MTEEDILKQWEEPGPDLYGIPWEEVDFIFQQIFMKGGVTNGLVVISTENKIHRIGNDMF
jgi:hypothetical protein